MSEPGSLRAQLDDAERRLTLVRSLAIKYTCNALRLHPDAARIFMDVAADIFRIVGEDDES